VLHFVIIQRTKSTPHDYKICDAFLSREIYSGEFELFTKPSKSDFLRVHQSRQISTFTVKWLPNNFYKEANPR
jgi:hypothetical protein